VLNEVEVGRHVNILMIDYSKAFDKVDINVAMHKLLSMHVRPELLTWIGNFLSGRQQCVKHHDTLSQWSKTTCGVPQGTKIGPVVFLAMVNQVATSAPKRWKYVDDITAGESRSTLDHTPELQQVMDSICADASEDHMSLNISKCATMQFHVGRRSPPRPIITANGQVVPFVSSVKLLGVTIQSNLTWDQHVDNMTAKANSKRYFLAVLRRASVQAKDLLQFYATFVRPTVEYAAPVWHAGITAKQYDQLEAIQRSSLRTIFPNLSYRRALLHTGLPTLRDRRVNLCRSFATSSLAITELAHWFPYKRSDCHTYNLRNNYQRWLPPMTKRLEKSPVNYIIKLLNE